ncbi:hypothetical protein FB451DRAFT_1183525 [Mycena latifolia]|nr:hypothetical protein FB451DRAFT_1183525 [Mycena latifolia]
MARLGLLSSSVLRPTIFARIGALPSSVHGELTRKLARQALSLSSDRSGVKSSLLYISGKISTVWRFENALTAAKSVFERGSQGVRRVESELAHQERYAAGSSSGWGI